jgi:hypothetical protein
MKNQKTLLEREIAKQKRIAESYRLIAPDCNVRRDAALMAKWLSELRQFRHEKHARNNPRPEQA